MPIDREINLLNFLKWALLTSLTGELVAVMRLPLLCRSVTGCLRVRCRTGKDV